MAVTDAAVLLPSIGHVLTATVGATAPTLADLEAFALDTADLPTGFADLGHTDLDQILTFGQEGGDTETKGSWQNASLREITTTAVVDYFVVKALQALTNDVLFLYYGGGTFATPNTFQTPDASTPTERAVCLIMLDGTEPTGLYLPKASIRRESEIEFSADDFTKLPLRFTALKEGSSAKSYWINDALGSA